MQVSIAKSAGFCFGVDRAVNMALDVLNIYGECWCLGELIHNREAVLDLERKGLRTADSVEAIPYKSRVIIRSHGVGKNILDQLIENGCEIIDATCPRVSRIHKIVQRADEAGEYIAVFGEKSHPEVVGICGWCKDAFVFSDIQDFVQWIESLPDKEKIINLVFQTTSNTEIIEQNINILKKLYTRIKIFDTICDTTSVRQDEAKKLSAQSDAMIVVGGNNSANSRHLAEICREYCNQVLFVQNEKELDKSFFQGCDRIGVTAGASTPAWIIKEVVNKMADEKEILEAVKETDVETGASNKIENPTEEQAIIAENVKEAKVEIPDSEKTFDQLLEDSFITISNGDTVTGIVVAITPTEVTLDLATKYSGYIPVEEFTEDDPSKSINEIVKIGDEITAIVVRVKEEEGTAQLSKRRIDAAKNWDDMMKAREEGTYVEGKVNEENKGGVVVFVHGIRVFVPASNTGLGRDEPMSKLLGQTVRMKITEVNRPRKRVVGSIRAVQNAERKEKAQKFWSEIEVGKVYNGVVKNLASYGAFVDIGGVDGMIHVSEISWKRIKNPAEVLSVGQEVEVHVLSFDAEKKKVSLGLRKEEDNPWKKFMDAYKVGDIASVKIVKLMTFGAFAEVMPSVDGLIHISQIANRRIGKPDEVLTVGDTVDAKITAIDEEKQKISLSIRALIEPEPVAPVENIQEADEQIDSSEDALVYSVSETGIATGVAPEVEETEE